MTPIFLMVGAPAVGKSSTAHALAAHYQKSVHIPVDDLRDMVVSGLRLPGAEWGADLVEQLRLARKSAAQMALDYRQAGFVAVIDDFWDPLSRLEEYQQLLTEPEVCKILLYPSQETALARNLQRAGSEEHSQYHAGGILLVYESLRQEIGMLRKQGWKIVDSTGKDIAATVHEILRGNVDQ